MQIGQAGPGSAFGEADLRFPSTLSSGMKSSCVQLPSSSSSSSSSIPVMSTVSGVPSTRVVSGVVLAEKNFFQHATGNADSLSGYPCPGPSNPSALTTECRAAVCGGEAPVVAALARST